MVRLATGVEAVAVRHPAAGRRHRAAADRQPRAALQPAVQVPRAHPVDQDHRGGVPPAVGGARGPRRRRHLLRPVPPPAGGRGRGAGRSTTGSRSGSAPRGSAPQHPGQRLRAGRHGPLLRAVRRDDLPRRLRRPGRAGAAGAVRATPGPRCSGVAGPAAAGWSGEQRFEEAATIRRRLETLTRTGGRFHRVRSLAACPEIVAARRDGDDWEIHVIRYGRLAAAGVATPARRAAGRRPRRPGHGRDRAQAARIRCRPPGSRRPSGSPTGWSSPASRLIEITGDWVWPLHAVLDHDGLVRHALVPDGAWLR